MIIGERLDEACVRSLMHGIADAQEVIIIEGASERFCLGMDFTSIDATEQRPRLERFATLMRALLLAPLPTLAVIDGTALGGGLGVAAACDYVVATDRSRFGLPEALYGLAPAIIRPALLTRLSPQRLRMLVMTCHTRDAHEAAALGLVEEVVAVDQLASARARAIRNLRRAKPDTVAALRRWDAEALGARLAAGVEETGAALARPAVRAAIEDAWS